MTESAMELRTLRGRLETLESEMEAMYGWLAELFESDRAAAGLFLQLSLQEFAHCHYLG